MENKLDTAYSIFNDSVYTNKFVSTLCEQGHLSINNGLSASSLLEHAETLNAQREEPSSPALRSALDRLRRAQKALESDNNHRIFRGELIEDIPEGLQRWLRTKKLRGIFLIIDIS